MLERLAHAATALTGHARHGVAADQCVALEAFEHLRPRLPRKTFNGAAQPIDAHRLPAQQQKDQHRLYVADAPEDLAGRAIRRTGIFGPHAPIAASSGGSKCSIDTYNLYDI